MCVEYAQLLSTAHRMIDGEMYYSLSKNNRRIRRYKHPNKRLDENLMKACHFNHSFQLSAETVNENNKKRLRITLFMFIICSFCFYFPN